MRGLKAYKDDKLLKFIIVYGILYIMAFFWLECREVSTVNIVLSVFDERIPFCEYFILPYFFWFIYVAATMIYVIFFCKEQKERKSFIFSFCVGMTAFLIVSYIYPNGHELRPDISGDGIFIQAVRLLYRIDTPTNILPSMHVFVTVACSIALFRQKEPRVYRWFAPFVWACSILIILSTLFLKQHTVVDVVLAFVLNVVCYILFYRVYFQFSKSE